MDYRRTRVEAFVVRNNQLLMVRERGAEDVALWRLPGTDLGEGEIPEEGVERALVTETGMEGRVLDFLHRIKPKEGDYRLILIHTCELRQDGGAIAGDSPKDRQAGPEAFEVSWRSLRNPELRETYQDLLRKAHL